MNKQHLQPLIHALLLAAGLAGGVFISQQSQKSIHVGGDDKIAEVMGFALENYVDSVGYDQLVDDAIAGMLEKLDPHSVYISKAELTQVNDQLNGSFEGIGVQFRIENDTIIVINPIPNGPSAKRGILAGDRIVKVDGKNVAGIGITNDDVFKLLKGEKGSVVRIGIVRKGVKGVHEYEIVRDVIPVYSLDAAFMLDYQTGFIRLNAFSATTYDEFSAAMEKLKGQGMKHLILDLRDNGGGYLNAAVDMADDFLAKGNDIVYTKGRHRKERFYKASNGGLFEDGKVVVLIDEFSASASEILAGAVQDNDRGLVIGRRSFGKGLVQEQIELSDGSAFRLTVARYYTPSGRCIQRAYDGGTEDYYLDFYQSLMLDDSAAMAWNLAKHDSLIYHTKGGRVVYGGGGIIPDSIVLHDYSFSKGFQEKFFAAGKLFEHVFAFVDRHRREITSAFPLYSGFQRNFTVPASLTALILNDAGVDAQSMSEQDRLLTAAFIKAAIAREVFGLEGYYQTIMPYDNLVQKALKSLR